MRKSFKHANIGQSILEFAILLAVVLAVLVVMQFIIKRAYQGRIKEQAEQLGNQYSPGHTDSISTIKVSTTSTSYSGGTTKEGVAIPEGVSLTISNTQTAMDKKETVDAVFKEK